MILTYQLNASEIQETLQCISWKKEGLFKKVNIFIFTITFLILIANYVVQPQQFFLFFLAAMNCAMLFFILYGQSFFRKLKAKKIAKNNGIYKIIITQEGIESKKEKHLFDIGKSEALFSQKVISLKIKKNVYCIPMRILSKNQLFSLTQLFEQTCLIKKISV